MPNYFEDIKDLELAITQQEKVHKAMKSYESAELLGRLKAKRQEFIDHMRGQMTLVVNNGANKVADSA